MADAFHVKRLAVLVEAYGIAPRGRHALTTLLDLLAADPTAPTTVVEPDRAVDIHVADSLVALELEPVRNARVLADIGAGAGLPGLSGRLTMRRAATAVFSAVAATAVPARTARPVLLDGMAGDQHRLPLVVFATTLTQRGASCRSLGADLPSTALATAIRRTAPHRRRCCCGHS